MLDTPTATCLVANISQHTRYMKLNLGYVRKQLSDHGERMLQCGADLVLPSVLLNQVDACLKHSQHLSDEIRDLSKDLSKYKIVEEKRRVNHIGEESNGYNLILLTVCGSSLLLGSIFLCKKGLLNNIWLYLT